MHFFTLQPRSALFQLDDAFISQFIGQQPQWGAIGYVTFKRTYSRSLVPADDGTYEVGDRIVELASRAGLHDTEEFWLTMVRVIEGMYQIQQRHCSMLGLRWDAQKAQESAQEAYQRAWDGKWLPPGRGLWMMGAPGLAKVGGAALLNCAFTSTKDIDVDFARPFTFMMDMSMLGVGVGFDCRGAGRRNIVEPQVSAAVFSVEDSREGWAAVLRHVLRAYAGEEPLTMSRDYSRVRAAGTRIKGFGGVSAGPEPLIQLIERDIPTILGRNIGQPITSTSIVDVMNCIGRCVVSGNVRRSAQIALGDMHDAEFRGLKNPESQQEFLNAYRWASNNTVMPHIGDDYDDVGLQTATNGEPGYLWLENAHNYARMNGVVDTADRRVLGVNPCGEQQLESDEGCNLGETFPARHDSAEDFKRTLKFAYLYCKTVTLIPIHDETTNAIQMRNRRIGLSQSGIITAMSKFGRRAYLKEFCDKGYDYVRHLDDIYSEWLCVPRSVRVTTVKPSGTVSLLFGVAPGIHYPHAEFYIRRMRIAATSALAAALKACGYRHEPAQTDPHGTLVFEFPVREEFFSKGESDVSMWEQLENAADLQRYWSDNAVSITVKFKPDTEGHDIPLALSIFESRLKSVSFLPEVGHGYVQAPYEATTEEDWIQRVIEVHTPFGASASIKKDKSDMYCDSDRCVVL